MTRTSSKPKVLQAKARKVRYATTSCDTLTEEWYEDRDGTYLARAEDEDIAPRPPDDTGWTMVGSACSTRRIYWFWSRDE